MILIKNSNQENNKKETQGLLSGFMESKEAIDQITLLSIADNHLLLSSLDYVCGWGQHCELTLMGLYLEKEREKVMISAEMRKEFEDMRVAIVGENESIFISKDCGENWYKLCDDLTYVFFFETAAYKNRAIYFGVFAKDEKLDYRFANVSSDPRAIESMYTIVNLIIEDE